MQRSTQRNLGGAVAVTSAPGGTSRAIFWGGALCGCLDISAAFIVYGFFGARPIPLLQGVAAGLLGPSAREGGLATAVLGLACHFFIAFSAAIVYVMASRTIPLLASHPLVCGPLYGVAVYFFMSRVVVPLSAARKSPFSLKMTLIGIAIHMICVGSPIAWATHRFSDAHA